MQNINTTAVHIDIKIIKKRMVSVTAVEKCMDDWLQLYNHFVIGLNIRGLKAGLRKTSFKYT